MSTDPRVCITTGYTARLSVPRNYVYRVVRIVPNMPRYGLAQIDGRDVIVCRRKTARGFSGWEVYHHHLAQ